MKLAHAPGQVERQPRAAAMGTFDGVHRGHQAVVRATIDTGLAATVVTFDPHPRIVLGNRVEQIATLERRLELFAEPRGRDDARCELHDGADGLEPEEFAESYLRAIGVEVVAAGEDFRFGAKRRGDLDSSRGSASRS